LNAGLKLKTKDQYRARRVALWLNLIPDLVQSPSLATSLEDYLTYTETLPFIPTIKELGAQIKDKSGRPALLESQPSSSLAPLAGGSSVGTATASPAHNESYFPLAAGGSSGGSSGDSLASYSTALSVTIAIGTSLLILNILIFAAVYYQRDRNKLGSRYSLSSSHTASLTTAGGSAGRGGSNGGGVNRLSDQQLLPVHLTQPAGSSSGSGMSHSSPPPVALSGSSMNISGGRGGLATGGQQQGGRRHSCRPGVAYTTAGSGGKQKLATRIIFYGLKNADAK
jgi:hypothetical protein